MSQDFSSGATYSDSKVEEEERLQAIAIKRILEERRIAAGGLSDEERKLRIASIISSREDWVQEAAATQEKKDKALADENARVFIEGGGNLWIGGEHIRVYLTHAQKLALYGISGTNGQYKDIGGEKVSNNKAWKITTKKIYYDVVSQELIY